MTSPHSSEGDERARALLTRALPPAIPLPPLDPQAIAARGRRELVRHRLSVGLAAVAAGAVLVTGVAVVPGIFPEPGGDAIGPAAHAGSVASPTPHASATASPPAGPSGSTGTVKPDRATARELTSVVRAAMRTVLPRSRFERDRQRGWPAFEMRVDSVYDYYLGGAWVSDDKGAGGVEVIISSDAHSLDSMCGGVGGLVSCELGNGARGEQWAFVVMDGRESGRPELKVYNLLLTKPDGTFVQLFAENSVTAKSLNASVSRPTPPMTKAQMLEFALDPALTVQR